MEVAALQETNNELYYQTNYITNRLPEAETFQNR
jgi:hypothetical protein